MTATKARISKGALARATARAEQHPSAGVGGEVLAHLINDELTRTVKPNRADRRARIFGQGLNVKQAARREQFLARRARRQAKAAPELFGLLADEQQVAA